MCVFNPSIWSHTFKVCIYIYIYKFLMTDSYCFFLIGPNWSLTICFYWQGPLGDPGEPGESGEDGIKVIDLRLFNVYTDQSCMPNTKLEMITSTLI